MSLTRFTILLSSGIRGFWRSPSINEWPSCPSASFYATIPGPDDIIAGPISLGPEHEPLFPQNEAARRRAPLGKPKILPLFLSMMGVPGGLIAMLPDNWLENPKLAVGEFPEEWERKAELPGCPWAWASEMHPCVPRLHSSLYRRLQKLTGTSLGSMFRMNCDLVWPKNLTIGMELDTPEYYGKVKGDLVVEKQLAMGGSMSCVSRLSPAVVPLPTS